MLLLFFSSQPYEVSYLKCEVVSSIRAIVLEDRTIQRRRDHILSRALGCHGLSIDIYGPLPVEWTSKFETRWRCPFVNYHQNPVVHKHNLSGQGSNCICTWFIRGFPVLNFKQLSSALMWMWGLYHIMTLLLLNPTHVSRGLKINTRSSLYNDSFIQFWPLFACFFHKLHVCKGFIFDMGLLPSSRTSDAFKIFASGVVGW